MNNFTNADEAEVAAALEYLSRREPLQISIQPMMAWALLAQLQLACRHPRNQGPTRRMVERFARQLQGLIAPEGVLARLAERGWKPEYDQEWPER
jgi:hypothetical protein